MKNEGAAKMAGHAQQADALRALGLTEQVVHIVDTSIHLPAAGLREILRSILEQVDQLIDCDASAVLLQIGDLLQLAADRGIPNPVSGDCLQFDLERRPSLRRLLLDGQPVILQDVASRGPFTDVACFSNLRACIIAPMVYQQRSIGALLMFKKASGHYSAKDAQAGRALANQAAMAIENARLYAETQRRALQLEAVSQVAQKITSILEVDELLNQLVWLIREKFGYYHVHIFLVDGHSNEIVLRKSSGHADALLGNLGLRLKIGEEGITGWVAGAGQPLLCNDVSQEPRYHPHELLPETQAELAVPLRVGDVVVGVLDVQSERRGAFHNDDITTLQVLADQIAVAIENAHLFQQTLRQYEAMQILHDISLDMTSQLESEQVLAVILKQAARLLNAHGSTLGIYDRQENVIRKIAVYNVPPEVQGVELRPGEGVAGQVVATGKPLIVNDYFNWPGRSPRFKENAFNAVIGMPLRWQGQVIGVLDVLDDGHRRPFTPDDIQVLGLFADLASIALKNAELYGQVKRASEGLEQKVEQRTKELARAREELAHKANELQRLLRVTVSVQEEERTRIARDLHDGSNQLITGALYELQAAQESVVSQHPEIGLQKLEIAKGLLRMIEAENRRIISGLRPSILDAQGLVPALKWHASTFQKLYGVACQVHVSGQPTRMSPEAETAIYRIMQESLNNVAAHAQASGVQIKIDFRPTRLRLVIEDDGVGFDKGSVPGAASGQMGLIGMRERAQSLGGDLEVGSARGQGTRLTLEMPLQPDQTSETAPA